MSHQLIHDSLSLSTPFLIALIATAALITAAALTFSAWKRVAAADRYLVLSIALFAPLVACVIATTSLPSAVRGLLTTDSTVPVIRGPVPQIDFSAAATQSTETACVLFAIWAIGALVFAALSMRQALRWRRIAQRSVPLHDDRIPQTSVPVSTSPAAAEPMVVGILRPSILLPQQYIGALDEEELRAVFAHELEHVRRRDNLTAVFHEVVTAVFWFDPFHWLARRRLLELRERACDEHVLEAGSTPQHYVTALAKSCHVAVESAVIACMSGFHIRERIESIMNYSSRRPQFVSTTAIRILSMVTTLAVVAGFALVTPGPSLAAEGNWRLNTDVRRQPNGMLHAIVIVFSPDNKVAWNGRVTTQDGVPFDVTSKDEVYSYRVAVKPPSETAPGEASLQVFEGGKIIHKSTSPVSLKPSADPISMNLKDADLRDVMSTFSQMLAKTIIVDPSAKGTITIDAVNVPWDVALADAIAPLGLVIESRGEEIHIVPGK
jgi:beta-lactamase regulating signal transducer with metallopeptidase domain